MAFQYSFVPYLYPSLKGIYDVLSFSQILKNISINIYIHIYIYICGCECSNYFLWINSYNWNYWVKAYAHLKYYNVMPNSTPEKSYHLTLLTGFLRLPLFFPIANLMVQKGKKNVLICIPLNICKDEYLFRCSSAIWLIIWTCTCTTPISSLSHPIYTHVVDNSRPRYVTEAS